MSRFIAITPLIGSEEWHVAFEDAGYELTELGGEKESRYEHPGGSCARLFACDDGYARCYIYPPGGTDRPTGRMIVPEIFANHTGEVDQPDQPPADQLGMPNGDE